MEDLGIRHMSKVYMYVSIHKTIETKWKITNLTHKINSQIAPQITLYNVVHVRVSQTTYRCDACTYIM